MLKFVNVVVAIIFIVVLVFGIDEMMKMRKAIEAITTVSEPSDYFREKEITKDAIREIFYNFTSEDLKNIKFIDENSSLVSYCSGEEIPIEDLLIVQLEDGTTKLLGVFYSDGSFKATIKRIE